VQAFVADALVRHGRVDVLVNNAGVMPLSLVEGLRVDDWNQMIDVNLRGVLHGIAAVLPSMREQGSGHIINVASTAANRVDPSGVVYSATKYAVRAVSEGLRLETTDPRHRRQPRPHPDRAHPCRRQPRVAGRDAGSGHGSRYRPLGNRASHRPAG